jgi:hypothetical protein
MSASGVVGLDDDVVAWITVRMHAPGTISVSGKIADKRFALRLLDHARDAITRQVRETPLVIPSRDVDVVEPPGLIETAHIPRDQRGDP